MRLKRLEISGFKTFRDKIVIDFSLGVSGIVGPNGCGKSNIIDALRWVMGEQRVKAVRGKKMDDVIFSGSENAPPVGMTEVAMTLITNGQPFRGTYSECHEVSIMRRLFREGESEYYINKVPCRLLDVKEFFMDAGIGTRTYSLIEQNSVASLVEAKPEERRQFIEEAAGIAKYKSRKESAMRKMEATKQNMVRLQDIMKEVKTQLNSISRQARRAEEYKILKNQIRETELAIAGRTYFDLDGRRRELNKEKNAVLIEIEKTSQEIQRRETRLEETKLLLLENEEAVARLREALYNIKNEINGKEQGIELSRRRIADIASQRDRDKVEIDEHERKILDISEEMEDLARAISMTEGEILDLKKSVGLQQAQLDLLKQSEKELGKELENQKVSYIDIVAQKAKLKNMESHIIKSLEDMQKRRERYGREIDEIDQRCMHLWTTLEELASGIKEDKEKRDRIAREQDNLSQEIERAKYRSQELETSISSLKEDVNRKGTRLASLQEFQEGYAWCSDGIRHLMSDRRRSADNSSGDVFLGLVADHVDVPAEYETAVEAVLGEKLQYVVVKSQEAGIEAIEYLKQTHKGRGSFVPLEVRNNYSHSSSATHLAGTIRLLDKVIVHHEFKDIMEYLLNDVLLIKNLRSGLSLWQQNGFGGTFVTPEGDIISPHGVLTGGSLNKGDKSLLAVRREIGELKEEIAGINLALDEALRSKDEISRLLLQWEAQVEENKSDSHKLEISLNGKYKDLERFQEELKSLGHRRGIVDFDNETLASEHSESSTKIATIQEERRRLENEETVLIGTLEVLKKKTDTLRTDLERSEEKLTALKILLATRDEKNASDRDLLAKLGTTKEGLQCEIRDKKTDFEQSIFHTQELANKIEVEQGEVAILYERHQLLEATLTEKLGIQQEKECLLRSIDKEIKDIRQYLDNLGKEADKLELSVRETIFHIDNLRSSLKEKHLVDLNEVVLKCASEAEGELSALREKLEIAKGKVDNFGEVNLLAINEHEALKERHDFLNAQAGDIKESLESLERTIERINRISKARFSETFEAVNICFKDTFARIFPGGHGRLYLTDEGDMLETGVDIEIQIPGKRTRNVSLLSGGEKALAAIALILSIIQYRPTPFLILDEVDAALDDANIAIFNNLMHEISKKSQIIMVTHNKKTMEVADKLYGVTMQNQGISSMVSVELN